MGCPWKARCATWRVVRSEHCSERKNTGTFKEMKLFSIEHHGFEKRHEKNKPIEYTSPIRFSKIMFKYELWIIHNTFKMVY